MMLMPSPADPLIMWIMMIVLIFCELKTMRGLFLCDGHTGTIMSDHSDVVEFYKYDLVEAQFHNNEWI